MHRRTGLELSADWITTLIKSHGKQPLTVVRYAATWRAFERFMDDNLIAHPFDVTLAQLEAFTTRPAHHKGHPQHKRAPTSIKNDVNALRSFYRWADDNEYARKNHAKALRGPTLHIRNPKPVPHNAWHALVAADLEPPLRLALYLGYYAGLRRHEILALAPSQVNPETITDVLRKGGDNANTVTWRSIYDLFLAAVPELCVGEEFPELMAEFSESKSHWLIPWGDEHYGPNIDSMNKRMTALCRRLKIPHVTPHMLRHSCATNLAYANLDPLTLKDFMNHSKIETTMLYIKMSGGVAQSAIRRATLDAKEWRG